MFCFWKNLRSPRTVVLVNLCVAIAVTDMLIVTMEIADLQNKVWFRTAIRKRRYFLWGDDYNDDNDDDDDDDDVDDDFASVSNTLAILQKMII